MALSYWGLTPKENEPLEAKAPTEMKEKRFNSSFEKEYIRKDGSRYPIRLNGVVVESKEGEGSIFHFAIITEMNDDKLTNKDLMKQRNLHASLDQFQDPEKSKDETAGSFP